MLSADFWANERDRLKAVLLPHMEGLAIAGANAATVHLLQLGIAVDPTLAHAQAAAWARQHTDDLLDLLGTTNQRVTGEIVANWIETPGANRSQLSERLQQVLDVNEYRAELISITETTRATAGGRKVVYAAAGLPTPVFEPPAHVKCRCDTVARRKDGVWYIVWVTDRDDTVCKARIVVPWGTGEVEGCRALHGVVVSAGPMLGQKL
jgi:hypothetical protein